MGELLHPSNLQSRKLYLSPLFIAAKGKILLRAKPNFSVGSGNQFAYLTSRLATFDATSTHTAGADLDFL